MSLTYIFFAITIIGIAFIIWLMLKANTSAQEKTLTDIKYKIDSFNGEVARIESTVKNEMVVNRQESNTSSKNTREELSGSFKQFSGLSSGVMNDTSNLQKTQLETFSSNLNNCFSLCRGIYVEQ